MANILITGIATLDIINQVSDYPEEDDEIRALAQDYRRGGNAANTAAVLRQYQHSCTLACTLANDNSGQFILSDLRKHNIGFDSSMCIEGSTPTSYIVLSQSSGSRTIVHYRDLPELSFDQFKTLDLSVFDWFHFEGRNIEQTALMMQHARSFNKPISMEVEKERPGLERLLSMADIIMFSKPYATGQGFIHPEQLFKHMAQHLNNQSLTCSWGDQGAWGLEHTTLSHSPAFPPEEIIDTIGAGDTFNAGIIHAFLQQQGMPDALHDACRLAGKKCGQTGFDLLVDV